MPSLKHTKRRITSVKNTQKITRAMKLVSVAKFARAYSAIQGARPYSVAFDKILRELLNSANCEIDSPFIHPPRKQDEKKDLLILISSDRGLCGSLNNNLFKTVFSWYKEKLNEKISLDFAAWGKRAQQFCKKISVNVIDKKEKTQEKVTYLKSKQFADPLIKLYWEGNYDGIYLAYAEFKSALSQHPKIIKLLPIDAPKAEETNAEEKRIDFIIEPSFIELVQKMLEKKITNTVFRTLLESAASEHGARMTAMDSATKNAKEVIRKLTLQYNRARQAAITKELIEITSGAEAL